MSDDELWKLFNDFFSDKTVKNTGYKFIFFYALLSNLENFDDLYSIAYTKVFEIFTETYWDLYIIHGKRQSRINQPSKAEKIFDEYVQTKLGQREFNKFNHMEKDEIVKKIQGVCYNYVIGAIYEDCDRKIYTFSHKDKMIILNPVFYKFMRRNKMVLLKLNYLEWIKYMEKVNQSIEVDQLEYLTY